MILRRPAATEDIANHWDWLAEQDLQRADGWLDRLEQSLQLWGTQPLMGRPRPELAPGLPSFAFERHVVFYLPLQGADEGLEVVRLLHASRDLNSAFAPPPR